MDNKTHVSVNFTIFWWKFIYHAVLNLNTLCGDNEDYILHIERKIYYLGHEEKKNISFVSIEI